MRDRCARLNRRNLADNARRLLHALRLPLQQLHDTPLQVDRQRRISRNHHAFVELPCTYRSGRCIDGKAYATDHLPDGLGALTRPTRT